MTGENAWVEDERERKLPELTDEERQAMESVDMTPILGDYRERYKVAMDFAMRMYRNHRELKGHVRSLLAMSEDGMITPKWFGEWMDTAKQLLNEKI